MRDVRCLMRRLARLVPAVTAVLLASTALAASANTQPPLPTEKSDIRKLAPVTPHRVLVEDMVGHHAKDGRVYVVDGDGGKLLGLVQAAYNANVVQAPDGKAFYVGETVWSRGNRGKREDLLATYDPQTLSIADDLVLPGRALVTPKKNDLGISADGSKVYVYDMVPTTAVHVVDAASHKVSETVGLPGCALVYPWGNAGFTTICGDGSLTNVSLADAKPSLTHSKPFFDPQKDPIFEHSPTHNADGKTWFISYSGIVHPVTLSATPRFDTPWSIEEAAAMRPAPGAESPFAVAWRPGGWQLAAMHYATGRLYVLMHKGTYWTHKVAGTEVWELDSKTHKLLRRIKLPHPSSLVGVTQDDRPLLFTSDDEGDFFIWDLEKGKITHTIKHLGDDLVFTVALGE